jgi:hypothetical protein
MPSTNGADDGGVAADGDRESERVIRLDGASASTA